MLTSTNFWIKIPSLLYSTLYFINSNVYVMHLIFLFSIKKKKKKERTLEYKVRILIPNFQFEGGWRQIYVEMAVLMSPVKTWGTGDEWWNEW